MKQASKLDMVRAALYEGPSIASEISATVGVKLQQASAYLCKLVWLGEAVKVGEIQTEGAANPSSLYQQTPTGAAKTPLSMRNEIDRERVAGMARLGRFSAELQKGTQADV